MNQKLICTDRTFENRVNTQIDAGWRIMEVGGVAAPYSASDKRPAREPRVVLWAVLERWEAKSAIIEQLELDTELDAADEHEDFMRAVQG